MGDINNIMQDKVTVMLDKEYPVRFNLKSFGLLSKRYGAVQKCLDKFFDVEDITQMTEGYLEVLLDLAEAGLMANEGLARAKIEDLIDSKNIYSIIIAIRKAIAVSVPQGNGEGGDPQ